MSTDPKAGDPGAVWRSQPAEKQEIDLRHFLNRRTEELYATTRSEIIMSIAAAVFLAAVMAWRFSLAHNRLLQLGFGLIVAWILYSLYWFRQRIWRPVPPQGDAIAASGLEYYRKALERRRDHLRNSWLWNGPLLLACLMLVFTFIGRAFPAYGRPLSVLPLLILLALWTGFGVKRRHDQAREIQQEIDEIRSL